MPPRLTYIKVEVLSIQIEILEDSRYVNSVAVECYRGNCFSSHAAKREGSCVNVCIAHYFMQ